MREEFVYRCGRECRSYFRGVTNTREALGTNLVAQTAEKRVVHGGVPQAPGAVCAEGGSFDGSAAVAVYLFFVNGCDTCYVRCSRGDLLPTQQARELDGTVMPLGQQC